MQILNLTRNTILLGCLAAALHGQNPARPPKTPVFISPTLTDSVVLLTPPPALNSKKMSKDLSEIFALHRAPSAEEVEKANWDNKHEDLFAIANVLGGKVTKESLPVTAAFWAKLSNDQGIVVSAAKKFFQHPRPYDLDSNIKSICGSKPGGPKNSYPSGHATVGYLSALVLSMMVPEKGEALRARADEYAHNRVVCGDHYAADLVASKEAAILILGNMLGNAEFQREFAAAKAEVRLALGL